MGPIGIGLEVIIHCGQKVLGKIQTGLEDIVVGGMWRRMGLKDYKVRPSTERGLRAERKPGAHNPLDHHSPLWRQKLSSSCEELN